MRITTTIILILTCTVQVLAQAEVRKPRTMVWDTGKKFTEANIDLANKDGWQLVPPSTSAQHFFKGDAVLENSRLQVLLGSQCGALVFSRSEVSKDHRRMSLTPLTEKRTPCGTITGLKIAENTGDKVALEVTSCDPSGESARTTIALGTARAFVTVTPIQNAAALRVGARSRFAVMPDFFGDDTVFDPRKSPGDKLFIPAENFLLNFTQDGNTILMSVWPAGDQEVQALVAGDKEERIFEGMEISFDKKSLHLAVLDAANIWFSKTLEQASFAGQDIATGWKKPFAARWRGDFRLASRTDSWEIEPRRRDRASAPFFGQIVWPCWFNQEEAMIRLIKKDYLGVALIYPLERVSNTPLAVHTPVDMLRETLGAGPCEYILDREGIGTRRPGGNRTLVSTGVCNTTGAMQHFFELGIECKERKILEDMADDVSAFNITVRQRLEEYRDCARQMVHLCNETNKGTPSVKPIADKVETLRKRLDKLFADRLPAMKTPEQNLELVKKVKDLTHAEDPENLGKFLVYGAQLRGLAGTQDSLASTFRTEVRMFRRELSVIPTNDVASAKLLEKLRDISRNVLRKKHYTEGA